MYSLKNEERMEEGGADDDDDDDVYRTYAAPH